MSNHLNLNSVLSLVSNSRLQSYRRVFQTATDHELYCTYIWSQNAAGVLYPLFQNAEVTLRNAVDKAARARFGDYWWDTLSYSGSSTKFHDNIDRAKNKLESEWRKKESTRRGIHIRSTGTPPVWAHDEIVAATDFSTWQFILKNQFNNATRQSGQNYLWPDSLGRAFKQFDLVSRNPKEARIELMNLIEEIRGYRNRIFHHEPVWIKAPHVTDALSAINTIRSKINKMEKLLQVIDARKLIVLQQTGVFSMARRVCSIEELHLYCGRADNEISTAKQRRAIRKVLSKANNGKTVAIQHNGATFGVFKVR